MDSFSTTVTDREGATGTLEERPGATEPREGEDPRVTVRLPEDQHVDVPSRLLAAQADGTYRLHGAFGAFGADADEGEHVEIEVLPLAEERMRVRKKKKETGRVRIHKTVHERTETIDEPLVHEGVDVERVPVNRVIDEAPDTRREEETTIIPILEERLVVTKQLVLKEELHVTRRRTEHHAPQDVTLRREEAAVGRIDLEALPDEPPVGNDRP